MYIYIMFIFYLFDIYSHQILTMLLVQYLQSCTYLLMFQCISLIKDLLQVRWQQVLYRFLQDSDVSYAGSYPPGGAVCTIPGSSLIWEK